MKKSMVLGFLFGLFTLASCGDDDTATPTGADYQIAIMSPTTEAKFVGDDIHVHVDFTDKNKGTVHHVRVRIFNKADATKILLDGPDEAHVHQETTYSFHADINLDPQKVEDHSDWILEAKVWGHEAGIAEEVETLEFHVHPK